MDDSQEISSHQDGTHKHGAHQDDTKIAVDMNQPSTLDVSAGSSEEDDRSDLNFRSKVSLFMSLFLRNLEFRDRAQQVKEKCKLSEGMSKDDLGSAFAGAISRARPLTSCSLRPLPLCGRSRGVLLGRATLMNR